MSVINLTISVLYTLRGGCKQTSRDRPKSAPYPRLKNSKRTSKCQFTVLENRKPKKMDRMARRGPLARAPGALKRGHFRNCQHFCRSWRGDPLEKKQIFEKKSHNAEKLNGGDPLGFLNTQSVVKYQRNWRGTLWREKNFRKKSHNAEKLKGGPFGVFLHLFGCKTSKNWRGKILFSEKKSRSAEKNWKGPFGPAVRPVWYVPRENRKNLFGSVR